MSNRTLGILVVVFFAGLLGLWLASDSGTPAPAVARSARPLFPQLSGQSLSSVRRVEIEGGDSGRVVLERRGPTRWERLEPSRGLASAGGINLSLKMLKSLRPLPEAGPIDGPPARFGLEPPRRVIRVFGAEGARPLAVLAIGTAEAGHAYVRADAGPVTAVEASDPEWFVKAGDFGESLLLPIDPNEARSLTLTRGATTVRAERGTEGDWELVAPDRAPADPQAIHHLLTIFAALRVGEPVAEAPGLDTPWLQVKVETRRDGDWSFAVGDELSGSPGRYVVRRGGDPQRFTVPVSTLTTVPTASHSLRSRRALAFKPDRVHALAVVEGGREHLVVREPEGTWRLERPDRAPADPKVVNDLIKSLAELEAAAVLAPGAISGTGLDAPQATVKLWLGEASPTEVPKPDDPGDLSLEVGRRDAGRRQAYVRTGGDTSVLAVLESFPASIPRGDLAFRDRNVQAIAPGRIARIEVEQGGQTDVIVAGERPGDYAAWRMEQPVAARVDARSVAALDLLLSRLRASSLIDTGPGAGPADPSRFGLDRPILRVSWTLRPDARGAPGGGTLRVGAAVAPNDARRYAALDGRPGVFTIDPRALEILAAELHERTVLTYPPEAVERLTLRWPGRPAWEVERRPRPFEGVDWVTRSGSGPRGVPVADLAPMAARLALLTTERFAQYEGPHRPEYGLAEPALSVEVTLSGNLGTRLLRIGARGPAGVRFAAAGTGDSGPVFTVPEDPWAPWLVSPDAERARPPAPELPERVFAPGG